MIDMFKPIVINNTRYLKRMFCALLELHSWTPLSDKKCDEIVQKWIKADDETVKNRLRGVKNLRTGIDFDVDYKKYITK